MPRETQPRRASRAKQIIAALKRTYPDAHCELNYSSSLELLVATILSAQCTDKRVNLVTSEIFRKYRTAEDYAGASQAELENDIRATGFFRNKAKNLKACCAAISQRHGGKVPANMDELINLTGAGRKTAHVALRTALGL